MEELMLFMAGMFFTLCLILLVIVMYNRRVITFRRVKIDDGGRAKSLDEIKRERELEERLKRKKDYEKVAFREQNKVERHEIKRLDIQTPKGTHSIETYSPKRSKTEKIIVSLIYAAVFLTAGYLIWSNFFPEDTPVVDPESGTYEIKVSSVGYDNSLSSLYIDDKNILGAKTETATNKVIRPITKPSYFNIVFNPKKIVAQNTGATLTLNLYNPDTEKGTSIYYNEELIVPNLKDYELLTTYENAKEQVWIKKELKNSISASISERSTMYDNSQELIYNELADTRVYSFKKLIPFVPEIKDYKKTETEIEDTFRGSLKLAVYTEDSLEIEFTKQDLNNYIGKDEYTIKVTTPDNSFYYSEKFDDDGVSADTKNIGKEQLKKIKLEQLDKNVYYIEFVADNNNQAVDSTIKEIKINSNKVMILEKALLWQSNVEYYTKTAIGKTIGFNYWQDRNNQTIVLKNADSTKKIELTPEWKSKTYNYQLNANSLYTISIAQGKLWIYLDKFSINKDTLFNIPLTPQSKFENPDVIIIDTSKLKVSADKKDIKVIQTQKVSGKTSFKLKAVDENVLYMESAKLELNGN